MVAFSVFAIASIFLIALTMALLPSDVSNEDNISNILRYQVAQIVEATQDRRYENPTGGFIAPVTLATIPGYEHLRSHSPEKFRSATATGINDSIWRYSRYAIWFESPRAAVGDADYILAANNVCGAADFNSASSWCGRWQSIWSKLEDKDANASIILAEKVRLRRITSKFYRRYNKDETFTPLANGTVRTIPQLVSYVGTAANCSGVFVYNEIPFTCDDMFNYWGIPLTLNQLTAKKIAIVNRTGVINSNGQPIRLSDEATVE